MDLQQNRAHSARIYDYFLGGNDNYPADREAAERIEKAIASVRGVARGNRTFKYPAMVEGTVQAYRRAESRWRRAITAESPISSVIWRCWSPGSSRSRIGMRGRSPPRPG
nr:SAM-dependent methyltransferase [Nocardia carnea]